MDSSDKLPRHLAIAFGLALVIYAAFFTGDQRLRHRKGPWEVTFSTNSAGAPAITVNQLNLGVSNVQINFQGESLSNAVAETRVTFDKPQQSIPFGKTKFEDLTYLPGSVAFDFFGHEVELLPRTLYLNKKEQPWKNGAVYELTAGEKLPPSASYDPRERKKRRFGR
jgi:hypothetical protein